MKRFEKLLKNCSIALASKNDLEIIGENQYCKVPLQQEVHLDSVGKERLRNYFWCEYEYDMTIEDEHMFLKEIQMLAKRD